MSSRHRFTRDALMFAWANLLQLVLNGILAFFLPKYLSIENFGYYRLFLLYSSIIGTAHFGLLDGLLIRWAENPARIAMECRAANKFIIAQHCVLVALLTLIALTAHKKHEFTLVIMALGVTALVTNWSTLSQVAFMAAKRFEELSILAVLTSIVMFSGVIAAYLLHHLTLQVVLGSSILSVFVPGVWIWTRLKERRQEPLQIVSPLRVGLDNIGLGWKVLLGNNLVILVPSIDRLFVSAVFPIRLFAIYAFASNALAIIFNITASMAKVVFPYLSSGISEGGRSRAFRVGQRALLLLWIASLSLYFPTTALVHLLLAKYSASLSLLRILSVNSIWIAIVTVIHANYLRVGLRFNRFIVASGGGALFALALLAALRRPGNLELVAIAMGAAMLCWWGINEFLLRGVVGLTLGESLSVVGIWALFGGVFVVCSGLQVWWQGFLAYGFVVLVLGAVCFRKLARDLVREFLSDPKTGSSGTLEFSHASDG